MENGLRNGSPTLSASMLAGGLELQSFDCPVRCELFQIRDEVGYVLIASQASEGHLGTLHHTARVADVGGEKLPPTR